MTTRISTGSPVRVFVPNVFRCTVRRMALVKSAEHSDSPFYDLDFKLKLLRLSQYVLMYLFMYHSTHTSVKLHMD